MSETFDCPLCSAPTPADAGYWGERIRLAVGADTYREAYEWIRGIGMTVGMLERRVEDAKEETRKLLGRYDALITVLDELGRGGPEPPRG